MRLEGQELEELIEHDAPARNGSSRSGPGARSRRGGRPSVDQTDPMMGRTLGSYCILALLGEGGMGRVYLAEHKMLGRQVALKLLRPEYAVKRDAVHRFFQEARAVNAIGHENIVDVTDYVELPDGETFFIMELLKGHDLADLLRGHDGPLPITTALDISIQVCDALVAAHETDIVHRDLKPDNIFIVNTNSRRNFVKLLDFGVAKLQGEMSVDSSWQTAAGSVIGTPAYMSPEQASGIPVDNRSDIYSLGAILYEVFTGHPVFRARSFGEYVVKHMNDAPIPPRELSDAPRIPLRLENVILRCLEKDPHARYQSAHDLREELIQAEHQISGDGDTSHPAMMMADHAGAPQYISASGTPPRRRVPVLPIAIGVLLLAGSAFWIASGLTLGELLPQLATQNAATVDRDENNSTAQAIPPDESPKTTRVKLITRPSGALVRIDGKPVGKTPAEIPITMGSRSITLTKRGYEDLSETHTIKAGTDELSFKLKRKRKRKPTTRRSDVGRSDVGRSDVGRSDVGRSDVERPKEQRRSGESAAKPKTQQRPTSGKARQSGGKKNATRNEGTRRGKRSIGKDHTLDPSF